MEFLTVRASLNLSARVSQNNIVMSEFQSQTSVNLTGTMQMA